MKRVRRLAVFALLLALGYAGYVLFGLPPRANVRALAKKNPEATGVMQQRAEEAAQAKHKPPRREQVFVPLSRISRNLIHAVVIAEDPKFFGHDGVDWDAIRESVERDLRERRLARGGSTITQQLAKNVFFTTGKSFTRKLREIIVARWLEADLSKRRILELYLNVIEWGDGVYGCEAAARRYYGKAAADVDEVEAAGLAGMIPSPRRINPRVNPARFARAQKRVLWLMSHAGYVKRDVGQLGAEPPESDDDSDPEPDGPAAAPTRAGPPPSV